MAANNNSSSSSLAQRAITIVLQHSMMPNLGWSTDFLDVMAINLRNEFKTNRMFDESDGDCDETETFNEQISILQQEVANLQQSPELLLPSRFAIQADELRDTDMVAQFPYVIDEEEPVGYYNARQLRDAVSTICPKYWKPTILSLQYQATNYASTLRKTLHELYYALSRFFAQQREKSFANSSNGLVIYQILLFFSLQDKMFKILEHMIFQFALLPCMMGKQRLEEESSFCNIHNFDFVLDILFTQQGYQSYADERTNNVDRSEWNNDYNDVPVLYLTRSIFTAYVYHMVTVFRKHTLSIWDTMQLEKLFNDINTSMTDIKEFIQSRLLVDDRRNGSRKCTSKEAKIASELAYSFHHYHLSATSIQSHAIVKDFVRHRRWLKTVHDIRKLFKVKKLLNLEVNMEKVYKCSEILILTMKDKKRALKKAESRLWSIEAGGSSYSLKDRQALRWCRWDCNLMKDLNWLQWPSRFVQHRLVSDHDRRDFETLLLMKHKLLCFHHHFGVVIRQDPCFMVDHIFHRRRDLLESSVSKQIMKEGLRGIEEIYSLCATVLNSSQLMMDDDDKNNTISMKLFQIIQQERHSLILQLKHFVRAIGNYFELLLDYKHQLYQSLEDRRTSQFDNESESYTDEEIKDMVDDVIQELDRAECYPQVFEWMQKTIHHTRQRLAILVTMLKLANDPSFYHTDFQQEQPQKCSISDSQSELCMLFFAEDSLNTLPCWVSNFIHHHMAHDTNKGNHSQHQELNTHESIFQRPIPCRKLISNHSRNRLNEMFNISGLHFENEVQKLYPLLSQAIQIVEATNNTKLPSDSLKFSSDSGMKRLILENECCSFTNSMLRTIARHEVAFMGYMYGGNHGLVLAFPLYQKAMLFKQKQHRLSQSLIDTENDTNEHWLTIKQDEVSFYHVVAHVVKHIGECIERHFDINHRMKSTRRVKEDGEEAIKKKSQSKEIVQQMKSWVTMKVCEIDKLCDSWKELHREAEMLIQSDKNRYRILQLKKDIIVLELSLSLFETHIETWAITKLNEFIYDFAEVGWTTIAREWSSFLSHTVLYKAKHRIQELKEILIDLEQKVSSTTEKTNNNQVLLLLEMIVFWLQKSLETTHVKSYMYSHWRSKTRYDCMKMFDSSIDQMLLKSLKEDQKVYFGDLLFEHAFQMVQDRVVSMQIMKLEEELDSQYSNTVGGLLTLITAKLVPLRTMFPFMDHDDNQQEIDKQLQLAMETFEKDKLTLATFFQKGITFRCLESIYVTMESETVKTVEWNKSGMVVTDIFQQTK